MLVCNALRCRNTSHPAGMGSNQAISNHCVSSNRSSVTVAQNDAPQPMMASWSSICGWTCASVMGKRRHRPPAFEPRKKRLSLSIQFFVPGLPTPLPNLAPVFENTSRPFFVKMNSGRKIGQLLSSQLNAGLKSSTKFRRNDL